ncbi:peptide chain release factor 2, partial [candidate division KSB1 bacterium]
IFDIDDKLKQIEKLEKKTAEDNFWSNQEEAQKILKQLSDIKETVSSFSNVEKEVSDLKELYEYAVSENDEESLGDIEDDILKAKEKVNGIELSIMLDGEDDDKDSIVTIHPGAGGTESQDWAEMLMRMYLKWFESRKYKTNVLDQQTAEDAGIKSVSIEVKGKSAYGYTKAEVGVHRLVRISPFDSNAKRHTSFASVFVYPAVDDNFTVEINPNDIRIDTYRASGAGGQHVNKTDSAIRITHFPSGLVVTCQNQRSQHKNKENAFKILRARLYSLKKQEDMARMDELEKSKTDIAWGNQIRSYILHPYNMVKDHRTNVETGNVNSVLDGNLDLFVNSYLLQKKHI